MWVIVCTRWNTLLASIRTGAIFHQENLTRRNIEVVQGAICSDCRPTRPAGQQMRLPRVLSATELESFNLKWNLIFSLLQSNFRISHCCRWLRISIHPESLMLNYLCSEVLLCCKSPHPPPSSLLSNCLASSRFLFPLGVITSTDTGNVQWMM